MNKSDIRRFAKTAKTVSEFEGLARATLDNIQKQRTLSAVFAEETFAIGLITKIREMGGAEAFRAIESVKLAASSKNLNNIAAVCTLALSTKRKK